MSERIIKTYDDKSQLLYNHGYKDNWRLVYRRPNHTDMPVYDWQLLTMLRSLAKLTSAKRAYDAFCEVYDLVTADAKLGSGQPLPDSKDLLVCSEVAKSFDTDFSFTALDKMFTSFLLEMIAEWYYKGSKLHHRLKRLGVYQVLFCGSTPQQAAHFAYHKYYKDLDKLMVSYGF